MCVGVSRVRGSCAQKSDAAMGHAKVSDDHSANFSEQRCDKRAGEHRAPGGHLRRYMDCSSSANTGSLKRKLCT